MDALSKLCMVHSFYTFTCVEQLRAVIVVD